MSRVVDRFACVVAAAALVATACGTHQRDGVQSAPSQQSTPASPSQTAGTPAHSSPPLAVAQSASSAGPIPRSAFGMHWNGYGHVYPSSLHFGSARIWDMGVQWADLQPSSPAWSPAVLTRLDNIVTTFTNSHVSPVLVLGMTPPWAARPCAHGIFPPSTCGPKSTGSTSPWADYVRFLVTRYDGRHGHPKVSYFETWNEPNLRNGWNGTITEMAALQQTAYSIVHGHGAGQLLLSASWATSYGATATPLSWLDTLLRQPGGRAYDITDLHVYPTVPPSKADYGPEWAINRLSDVRAVLSSRGVGNRPVWNTEMNIGAPYDGAAAAGQVARAFLLATQAHVARTFWYAADNRAWGGVFLENSDFATLTPAGVAYAWLATTLTGARPAGCATKTLGNNMWNVSCKYTLAGGTSMLAVWTTGPSYEYRCPAGTTRWYTVTGASRPASSSTRLTVSHIPIFVVGMFG